MRIVLIGQAAFGADVFNKLKERGQDIVGVFCPPDPPKGKLDPLKEAAQAAGVPVFQPRRMKDSEAAEQMQTLNADLGVLAFVTDIVPPQVFNQPRLGSICYHPSILPKHRGASAINWAVIYGDTKTGLTIFWVDEGIDTGEILLQKEVEIGLDETTGALYFNKLYPLGVEAVVEAVEMIQAGTAPRIPQDHAAATYEPPCDEKVSGMDWNIPGRALYDFIRGCDPQPGATTTLRGEKVKFYNASYSAACHSHTPGEILEVNPNGLTVAARGGTLQIQRFRTKDLGKVKAEEFIKAKQPKVGERFGT
ncbi:MAG: methionyl-tRNA formyltransferase [Deltaproteobacteria bacterium]|nr:methionyl-tRNA formyltransferase [Deltaproteobacteria bacterium]MBW1952400.1 methionyl-tRNA formyltransferase [Deltaproteobacteria bacterium]MBW1985911.1 methionyl-tRNA formyltransferase [Deltaproteobacteria bacterium]MBW2133671.1 methionyl-tRNA formyltransferase [Deltaproteobacteria bacterium]